MYIHPQLLESNFPRDPRVLTQAIRLSLMDNPRVRDLRPLMSLLLNMENVATSISRHILRRTTLIAGAEWHIVPIDGAPEEWAQRAQRRLQWVIWESFHQYVQAQMFGCSLTLLEWRVGGDGVKPAITKKYQPVELEAAEDFRRGIALLSPAEHGRFTRSEIQEEHDPVYLSYVEAAATPGGILRKILFQVFMLNLNDQEWAAFIRLLKGIVQGKYGRMATPDDKRAGRESLETVQEHNYTYTSEDISFVFTNIVNGNSGNSFDQMKESIKRDIETLITGTNTLAGDEKRNALTVQYQTEEDIAFWGRQGFTKYINSQLIEYDWRYNHSAESAPAYEFKFKRRIRDIEANARVLSMVAEIAELEEGEVERLTGVKIVRVKRETEYQR